MTGFSEWQSNESRIRQFIENTWSRLGKVLNKEDICLATNGLANMKIVWSEMSPQFQNNYISSLSSMAQIDSAVSISCLIYSWGMMNIPLEEFCTKIQGPTLLSVVTEESSNRGQLFDFDDQAVSNILYGLSLLNANFYQHLSIENQNFLLKYLQFNVPYSKVKRGQCLSNSLYGLGKLEYSAQNSSYRVWEALPSFVDVFSSQEFSNFVYGLAKIECSWDMLSLQSQDALMRGCLRLYPLITNQVSEFLMSVQ